MGDITKIEVDCIVNPVRGNLMLGSISNSIATEAGPFLQCELKEIGHCKDGQAVTTRGYDLPAKYIIHTTAPRREQKRKTLPY